MAEVNCDGVAGTGVKTIQKAIPIPPIAVSTNTRFCNVVQISYELEVESKVPGCRKNVVTRMPITVGAIPINFGNVDYSTNFVPSAPMPEPCKF